MDVLFFVIPIKFLSKRRILENIFKRIGFEHVTLFS